MCTLVFGLGVAGPGSVAIGANRDERPERPTAPPGSLAERPRLTGGRDLVAGGTWLALRERHAVIAMLNRRPRTGAAPPPATLRSRGLLALDVAATPAAGPEAFPSAALERARDAVARGDYAPFSLVCLSVSGCWVLAHDGLGSPRVVEPDAGWHVLTHADLDDPTEPRTHGLLPTLRDWRPAGWTEVRAGLERTMADHGQRSGNPVCIHRGAMPTVSSSLVMLAPGAVHYAHREGRPCEGAFEDLSGLLA